MNTVTFINNALNVTGMMYGCTGHGNRSFAQASSIMKYCLMLRRVTFQLRRHCTTQRAMLLKLSNMSTRLASMTSPVLLLGVLFLLTPVNNVTTRDTGETIVVWG